MAIKVLQVGAGGFGGKWCRDFLVTARNLDLVEVVGVVDIDGTALGHAADVLGLSPDAGFTSAAEAFKRVRADACFVVVPPSHHEAIIMMAVDAGMHVLAEKPIADSMEGAVRVAKAIERAGLKMAVAMSHRYDEDKQTLSAIVRSGHLGRLNTLHCRLSADYRTRDSWRPFRHKMAHPLLLEGAVHHLDILNSLAGAPCKTVYATTWKPDWAEFDGDTDGIVVMTFANGLRADFVGSKSSPIAVSDWSHEEVRADGERGIAILEHREVEVFTRIEGVPSPTDSGFVLGHSARRGRGMKFGPVEGRHWRHDLLIERFVGWLVGGPEMETNVDANLRSLAIVFAAIESSESGRVVDMDEFLARHGIGLQA